MKPLLTTVAILVAILPLTTTPAQSAERHPFGFDDMVKMYRLSDPQVSPDGRWVVFTAGLPNLKANKVEKDLWLVPADGKEISRLTNDAKPDYGARWFPDSRRIAYISVAGEKSQVFAMDVFSKTPHQLTNLPVDADNVGISPDGRWLSFTAEVYPDCPDLKCTTDRDAQNEKDPVKVRTYDNLLFRHWDSWEDGKRSHLFVMPATGDEPIDLTAGQDTDVPTKPWGGTEEISFSPDGMEIAFTVKATQNSERSTNSDVFVVNISTKERRCISCPNEAWDSAPAYSPDGRYIAYLAMERPGYESDRTRIVLYDRASGEKGVLTEGWDRSPDSITWSADSKTIFTTASDTARKPIFAVDVSSGTVTKIINEHYNSPVTVTGTTLAFLQDSFTAPAEVFTYKLGRDKAVQVTDMNKSVLNSVEFSESEEFWFTGADGDRVQGWFFKPADFKEGETYPLAYIIHGGPQGDIADHFHYRWNIEIAPGRGHAAAAINFHGSTGFGQAFTDSIRNNWGGRPYKDLMKGLDHILKVKAWIDPKRVCALGASYGGYMINWIAGQTDRFACLVNHDGQFSIPSSYYNTDELWFPEWEMQGAPHTNRAGFESWSPQRFVKNWKTPMLVIHGAKDFRVVETEGLSTFTALRRMEVPARLLYFPDENHWVLKPLNSKRWHEEVYGWLDKWTNSRHPNHYQPQDWYRGSDC